MWLILSNIYLECTKTGTIISYKNGLASVVLFPNANWGLPLWEAILIKKKKRSNLQHYRIAQDSYHRKASRNMENMELLLYK